MKRKSLLLLTIPLLITGCQKDDAPLPEQTQSDYGVFLGLNDSEDSLNKLLKYKEVAIEIDSFSSESIKILKDNNIQIDAYLSIGSLENYKPYYNDFKDYTFMDYDNWPNERWVDVSVQSYQDKMIELASLYKSKGADALFLDNYDVYYIVCEEYTERDIKEQIYSGLNAITSRLYDLNLKLILNSGIDYLERLQEENKEVLKKIYGLNQENVFASIEDYEKDVFGEQSKDDHEYYVDAIENMAKEGLKIYLLEYTKDEALIKKIDKYCKEHSFTYYISSTVGLY